MSALTAAVFFIIIWRSTQYTHICSVIFTIQSMNHELNFSSENSNNLFTPVFSKVAIYMYNLFFAIYIIYVYAASRVAEPEPIFQNLCRKRSLSPQEPGFFVWSRIADFSNILCCKSHLNKTRKNATKCKKSCVRQLKIALYSQQNSPTFFALSDLFK